MFTPAIPIRIPNWRLIAACRPAANAYVSLPCPKRTGLLYGYGNVGRSV